MKKGEFRLPLNLYMNTTPQNNIAHKDKTVAPAILDTRTIFGVSASNTLPAYLDIITSLP
jgi:hypothetical protein